MQPTNLLVLPKVALKADYLEDEHNLRLVLEHYDREQLPLRRYLLFLGVDNETAQEVVQESFLKLHQHLLRGGQQGNLRAWLYKVAHNLARNTQTAFRSKRTERLSDLAPVNEPAASGLSAEEALLARERQERFRQAMDMLTPAQRDCLLLRARGLKYREIAEALDLSVSTVAENVQRGLENLKELI